MADTFRRRSTFSPPLPSSSRPTTESTRRLALPPLEPSIRSAAPGMPIPIDRTRRRGYDHRRPVSTFNTFPAETEVVDLTGDEDIMEEEQGYSMQPRLPDTRVHQFNRTTDSVRMPRFGRDDIIDLSLDSSPPQQTVRPVQVSFNLSGSNGESHRRTPHREDWTTPRLHREDSSGNSITMLDHRRREYPRRVQPYQEPPTPSPPRTRHHPQQAVDLTTLSDPAEDDLIITREVLIPNPNPALQSPTRPAGRHVHRVAEPATSGIANTIIQTSLEHMRRIPQFNRFLTTYQAASRLAQGFTAPNMNYSATGFQIGGLFVEDEAPRAPAYQAPPDPNDGFTRSPAKTEEVVCPACGDPLAHGASDEKRQVWVVKACGHVSSISECRKAETDRFTGILRDLHGEPA